MSDMQPNTVVGPSGQPLTLRDLPPPTTRRWVIRRKAEVVIAVQAGLITFEEACKRYNLSVEELTSWQILIKKHGMKGLRATRVQEYRPLKPKEAARQGEPVT